MRIAAKRLRYTLEICKPLYPTSVEEILAAVKHKAAAVCIQGCRVDDEVGEGRWDVVRGWVELVKSRGLPAGRPGSDPLPLTRPSAAASPFYAETSGTSFSIGAGHDRGARMRAGFDRRDARGAHDPPRALLVFVDVMKELPATLVLRPFNSDTLAVVTYQLARDERLGEAALPALALVLVGLVPVILLSRTLRSR